MTTRFLKGGGGGGLLLCFCRDMAGGVRNKRPRSASKALRMLEASPTWSEILPTPRGISLTQKPNDVPRDHTQLHEMTLPLSTLQSTPRVSHTASSSTVRTPGALLMSVAASRLATAASTQTGKPDLKHRHIHLESRAQALQHLETSLHRHPAHIALRAHLPLTEGD